MANSQGSKGRHYATGRRCEYKSIHLMESYGFYCIRSAGSKGLWDLMAIHEDVVVLIQVKRDKRPSARYMQPLVEFVCPPYVKKILHVWRTYESYPDVYVISDDLENPMQLVMPATAEREDLDEGVWQWGN